MNTTTQEVTQKRSKVEPLSVLWRWTTSRYKGYAPEQVNTMLREREESKRLIAVADHLDLSEMDYDKLREMMDRVDIERVVGIVSHIQPCAETGDHIITFDPNHQFFEQYDFPDSDGPIEYVTIKGHPELRLVLAAALVGQVDRNSPFDRYGGRLLTQPHLTCFYFQQAELV